MARAQKPDSAKRTSPFKSAGASIRLTTGTQGVRISDSNAGYTVFWGSVKCTGYSFHSPVSPLPPLLCVTVCHHISTGLYCIYPNMWPQFFPYLSPEKWVVTVTLKIQLILCLCLPENQVCHGVSLCSCTYYTFCNNVASLAPLYHQEQKCWRVKTKGLNEIWNGFRTHHRVNTMILMVIICDLPFHWRQLFLQKFWLSLQG
jgi:hypothetical protein